MSKPDTLDPLEEEIMTSLERGEWQEVKEEGFAKDMQFSARDSQRKKPITLRIQGSLLNELRVLAEKEWLPYQTYIQTTLYKHAKEKNELSHK